MEGVNSIALELRTRCQGCGQNLPINACTEKVVCHACQREIVLDADVWAAVFEEPIDDKGGSDTVLADAGDIDITVTYAAAVAGCPKCKAPLPDEASAFAMRGWTVCPACGNKLSIRTAPPVLVDLGATVLIGEDLNTPEPAAAAPIVMTACLGCKEPLRLDGARRLAPCATCGAVNYLTIDLWQHFHPVKPAVRWFACVTREMTAVQPAVQPPPSAMPMAAGFGAMVAAALAPQAQVQQQAPREMMQIFSSGSSSNDDSDDDDDDDDGDKKKWSSLENCVIDANNLFYCGGEVGYSDAVWCMGEDLKPRWVRRDLEMSDIRVALDVQHGRLLAWSSGKHSAMLLNAADGSTIGAVGGREPVKTAGHQLDLEHCKYLLGDLDGTWVGLFENRLARFDPHGAGIAMWPPHGGLFGPKPEKLESLYVNQDERKRYLRQEEDVAIENVGNHPRTLDDYCHLGFGWDGRLYAEYNQWVAAFDRTGKRIYKLKLPVDDVDGSQLGADAQGNLYARCTLSGDPSARVLVRVAPDGSRADIICQDRLAGGAIGKEDEIVVARDGTVFLIDYGMCMRKFAPDGRMLWQSPASKSDDESEDRDAARRA